MIREITVLARPKKALAPNGNHHAVLAVEFFWA